MKITGVAYCSPRRKIRTVSKQAKLHTCHNTTLTKAEVSCYCRTKLHTNADPSACNVKRGKKVWIFRLNSRLLSTKIHWKSKRDTVLFSFFSFLFQDNVAFSSSSFYHAHRHVSTFTWRSTVSLETLVHVCGVVAFLSLARVIARPAGLAVTYGRSEPPSRRRGVTQSWQLSRPVPAMEMGRSSLNRIRRRGLLLHCNRKREDGHVHVGNT